MARQASTTIVAYNGIDGACTAAMALLKYPKASLVISSSGRIGSALEKLRTQAKRVRTIHVCGLGAQCEWAEVARPLKAMTAKGAEVLWYCGRGYLDAERERYAEVCTPIFLDAGTNTGAVCRHLQMEEHPRAQFLLELAKLDPNVGAQQQQPSADHRFWADFIQASILEYLKYRDLEAYAGAIVKLAKGESEPGDDKLVAIYRRSGAKYVLLGRSQALSRVQEEIIKCAGIDEHVLVTGESGVGKEHVAHLIHERSDRAMETFVPVNCADFAGNVALANSMLFGHLEGAFTGAVRERRGQFMAADRGILFLDEVGELPPEVQAKLLRVLEDGQITPLGADLPSGKADVRVIAATNRDLPAMIRRGDFRADLFYRLASLHIHVPPLRERAQDIRAIAGRTIFELGELRRKLTKKDYMDLAAYDWPGNVRQLIHLVRQAAQLGTPVAELIGKWRAIGDLSSNDGHGGERFLPTSQQHVRPLGEARRAYAARALELYGGNVSATARALDVSVNTLKRLLSNE